MKKVLYVIGSLGLGGAESQIVLLIKSMASLGWDCELFVLDARGPLRSVLDENSIKVHEGGFDPAVSKFLRIFQLLKAFFKLWKLERKIKPNVVHAYLPLTNFMGSVTGYLAGVPKIITSRRALGTHQDRHSYMKIIDRMTNALSDCVVVNSRAVWEDTIKRDKINPQKLVQISNGLNVKPFESAMENCEVMRKTLGLSENQIGIVTVANLIPYKGHRDLLLGLQKILKETPDVFLFLVGEDRGIEADLRKLTEELGISNRVNFLGQRPDIPNILTAMDIFILPSHEEGSSNALLEAMASKLPIIATEVGGNKEALDQGHLGILVPPHDPKSIEKASETLVKDSAKRAQFRQKGQAYVNDKYSIESMVAAHINIYLH